MTAKEAGPADSFNFYETYLKQERTVPNAKGQPMKSKVLHVKKVGLAKHTWVDGMHLSSEIEDFYTRYLATVKQGLAIIVSFSAHKAYYTKYSSDFLRAIKSLKVVANRNLLAAPNAGQKGPTTNPFGGPTKQSQLQRPDFCVFQARLPNRPPGSPPRPHKDPIQELPRGPKRLPRGPERLPRGPK